MVSFFLGVFVGGATVGIASLIKLEHDLVYHREEMHKFVDEEHRHLMGY